MDAGVLERWSVRRLLAVASMLVLVLVPAIPAEAHEGEENVPAITDVQEAIAILAEHPGLFAPADVKDHAMDKVGDALESNDARGVDLHLVARAKDALDADQADEALTLLERSIGACPGAPVIEPGDAPREPPALASPCAIVPHIQALDRSPVGGAAEPVLIGLGAVLIVAGLGLTRRIR